jgi:NAD(P)-dependent dehydrogenase (short-subunit alcohol dehydrogenase family)
MTHQLERRHAICTGGGSGVDATTARLLHLRRAQVLATDRDDGASSRVNAGLGARAAAVHVDNTLKDEWARTWNPALGTTRR